jgi:hypothetical protein
MKALRSSAGQFIPITAMVTFTTVIFLIAVVNVYKVAQAKIKVQNLADAVALNVASQMASSMNKVADLNEWMNHMVDPGPNGTPSKPGTIPDCRNINPDLPPISCAENPNANSSLNMFTTKGTAASYALLVQTINQAQQQFINAYNNFIGAGTLSNGSASTQFNFAGRYTGIRRSGNECFCLEFPERPGHGAGCQQGRRSNDGRDSPCCPQHGRNAAVEISGSSDLGHLSNTDINP